MPHRTARPREHPSANSSGGDEESKGGVRTCSRCKWPFSNAHPSSKKRAAHRRHCGKIEGYPLLYVGTPVDSDAGSSSADSIRGSSAKIDVEEELLLGREMRLENADGGKDTEELVKSGNHMEVENPSNLGAPNVKAPEPSDGADCEQFDDTVWLQDTSLPISEKHRHGVGFPFILEDTESSCSTVTNETSDGCASRRNSDKPDSEPLPSNEGKCGSGVSADVNGIGDSEKDASAMVLHMSNHASGLDREALEVSWPEDSVASPRSFGAGILNKPVHHPDASESASIQVEKRSAESQGIAPQGDASRTDGSTYNDATNNDAGVTETASINKVNGHEQKIEENCSYTAKSMSMFQELGEYEIEKKQELTDLSTGSGMGKTANESRSLGDGDVRSLANHVINGHQDTRDNSQLVINPATVQSEAHENVGEDELKKEPRCIESTISDNIVAENGTYMTFNHLANAHENFSISRTYIGDIPEGLNSAHCNGDTGPLNCDLERPDHNECLDLSTSAQCSTMDLGARSEANANVFPEEVHPNIHHQFSGDESIAAEKERPDDSLGFLDALDETTCQRESAVNHCGRMDDGSYPSSSCVDRSHVNNPIEEASGGTASSSECSVERLTSMNHGHGKQTATEIEPDNHPENSISCVYQDGNKEVESQGSRNELKTRVVTWKDVNDGILAESKKLHTPLKKLLWDETHDENQGTTKLHTKLSPSQDVVSLGEKYSGQATKAPTREIIEHSTVHDTNTMVPREWSSPARLPITKNVKGKNKGKQLWVPLLCCSTNSV